MTEELQNQLAARSEELQLAWCELLPDCQSRFFTKRWVLLIDDRRPGKRALTVVPPEMIVNLPFVLAMLRQYAEQSSKEQF